VFFNFSRLKASVLVRRVVVVVVAVAARGFDVGAVKGDCFGGGGCFDGGCFDWGCFDGGCVDGGCFDGVCVEGGDCIEDVVFVGELRKFDL